MKISKKLILLLIVVMIFSLSGCKSEEENTPNSEDVSTNEELGLDDSEMPVEEEEVHISDLLPNEGFLAIYNGTLEYGRFQKINKVETDGSKSVYEVEGINDDVSGTRPISELKVNFKYLVDDSSIQQIWIDGSDYDLKYKAMTLVAKPLEIGNTWNETVETVEGKLIDIQSTIRDIVNQDGTTEYIIETKAMDSEDVETRVIREGYGIVSYTCKMPDVDMDFTYFIYKEASGYGMDLPLPEDDQVTIENLMYDFNSSWVDYVNNGDEKVFDFVVKDEGAYKNMKSVNPKGLTEEFLQLDIKYVDIDGSNAVAGVHEKIKKIKNGKETVVEYDWIYSLKKDDGSWKIVSYKKDK